LIADIVYIVLRWIKHLDCQQKKTDLLNQSEDLSFQYRYRYAYTHTYTYTKKWGRKRLN